jgi:hypothetical protein
MTHGQFSASANEWAPTEHELSGVVPINHAAIEGAGEGESMVFRMAGYVVLIGDSHGPAWIDWIEAQRDVVQGTITVAKRGVLRSGCLHVAGCPDAKRGVLETAITLSSQKDVEFV